jgi:glycerol-3-phosphate dehydrogenase (NAD(P)+)
LSKNILIFGNGSFGVAMASALPQHNITFACRSQKSNVLYKQILQNNVQNAIAEADYIFIATQSNATREICNIIKSSGAVQPNIIMCSKGINVDCTNMQDMFYSNIIFQILPNSNVAVLSGASFADEIVNGIATQVNIASENNQMAENICTLFTNSNVVATAIDNITAVQIMGAYKNIMAIAMGITDAIQDALNATRHYNQQIFFLLQMLNEMQQVITAICGKPVDMISSAGIGDIILTCINNKSRNKQYGLEIGMQIIRSLSDTQKSDLVAAIASTNTPQLPQVEISASNQLTEGFFAIKPFLNISKQLNLQIPTLNWLSKIFNVY